MHQVVIFFTNKPGGSKNTNSLSLRNEVKGKNKIQPTDLEIHPQLLKTHFHDPLIQQNIRLAKEEQYQKGFLLELVVYILGYALNPLEKA